MRLHGLSWVASQLVRRIAAVFLILPASLTLYGSFALTATAFAQQQPYPTKPIRLVLPFSAGGGADNNARIIAEPLRSGSANPSSLITNLVRAARSVPILLPMQHPMATPCCMQRLANK